MRLNPVCVTVRREVYRQAKHGKEEMQKKYKERKRKTQKKKNKAIFLRGCPKLSRSVLDLW